MFSIKVLSKYIEAYLRIIVQNMVLLVNNKVISAARYKVYI